MGYRSLSLIQVVFITLCAISVLDYGYTLESGQSDGLLFNKIMFDETDGILGPIFKDIDFWGEIQFWAYCFFIVAACQLGKALGSDK
jgi:hypothetical protein